MTEEQLVAILATRYREGLGRNEGVVTIHLFGIEYAKELDGKNLKSIALKATAHESYFAEISKGINLARYVQAKPNRPGGDF